MGVAPPGTTTGRAVQNRYHRLNFYQPMARVASDLEWTVRLSEQLETLSKLAESLTYRILELEERLACQDAVLKDLQSASEYLTNGFDSEVVERIQRSEERLARMEELLQETGKPSHSARTLRALPTRSPRPRLEDPPTDDVSEEQLFPEDAWVDDGSQEAESFDQDPFNDEELPHGEEPLRGHIIAS